MFRGRLPSSFITSHKMPRLPRNLHLVHHLTQPWQCDSQNTRNATRLKCCACHAKWHWTRPKCCTCHENCNSSCENVAKVLRLPQKTIFDTLQKMSECHQVPRLPRETKQRDVWNLSKSDPFCRTYHRHGHMALTRTVADGCGRLRAVRKRRANTPSTPSMVRWCRLQKEKEGGPARIFLRDLTRVKFWVSKATCDESTIEMLLDKIQVDMFSRPIKYGESNVKVWGFIGAKG